MGIRRVGLHPHDFEELNHVAVAAASAASAAAAAIEHEQSHVPSYLPAAEQIQHEGYAARLLPEGDPDGGAVGGVGAAAAVVVERPKR